MKSTSDNRLLEISLIVEDELVEPVAEVLGRYVKGGVAIESTAINAPMDAALARPIGPLRVFGYLPVNERTEETRQQLEQALWYLGRIRPLPEPQYRTLEDNDWTKAWKEHYHPIPIGKTMMIVPAWLHPTETERIPIRIDPGMAFGTGTHPTTQLCLELVEEIMTEKLAERQPIDVLDIGCGTAILSIAALKLGARHALGLDIDPDAVRAARQNALSNRVQGHIDLDVGSLEELKNGLIPFQQADLVLANILAPVCIQLLDEGLGMLLNPGAALVLSGILEGQAFEVILAAHRNGLQLDDQRQSSDWVALRFSRADRSI
jgi:ribosomal protein L11 methyltransferase